MDEALRDVLGLSLSECHELAFGELLKLSLGEARNPAEALGDELGDELYMQVQEQQNSHYGFWPYLIIVGDCIPFHFISINLFLLSHTLFHSSRYFIFCDIISN